MSATAATVVLVHGAWHGAWCWDRVVPGLRDAGVDAIAIDLPGHGRDSGPFRDLHGDASAVTAALDTARSPAVLVGHSYGGAVITEAGVHDAVAHLVYLCAFAITTGESCASAGIEEPDTAAISHAGRPDFGQALVRHDGDTVTLTPEGAALCLYNASDPATVDWAVSRLGAHPFTALTQTPTVAAWETKPSTYVVCTDDLAVHPDLQRVLARRCTHTVEWATDHSPFAGRPELVVALLADLARRVGRAGG